MARIIAIDYGGKRCGIAVTDPMQIIATGLAVVGSQELMAFLKDYTTKETIERFVVGEPKRLDNTPAQSAEMVANFVKHLQRTFPDIPVEMIDERFTSKIATQSMLLSGMKKKDRQQKGNVDIISATIILQSYLEKAGK
ncbi:MAG: Holliday junction resolvase RuvX [Chitinophagales bacterium]|nr:Holliday junction resolvase RuvX [Chitinophagales bacterium]